MSIKIMNEAWEVTGLDPTAKLILMCLADHANEDDRTCWPAISTIARKCDVHRSTVKRQMVSLENTGHIKRRSRTGDSTLYYILPEGVVHIAPGSQVNQGVVHSCEPGGGSQVNPKPSVTVKEPSIDICDLEQAFALYNVTADRVGIPKAQKLTSSRQSKLRARLRDCEGVVGWASALSKLEDSDYCTGKVNGWKADFDFVLQEKSFNRLMEGSYDNRGSPQKQTAHQNTMNNIRNILADDERERRETENHADALGLLADSR